MFSVWENSGLILVMVVFHGSFLFGAEELMVDEVCYEEWYDAARSSDSSDVLFL